VSHSEGLSRREYVLSQFDTLWNEHRRYVLDVAYRMLGSVSDAEDVVQEAFARLMKSDIDAIDDVRGWLVVVVTRLCIDELRSARSRRESYVGTWLPEPVVQTSENPAEQVTLDDSVRIAMLVVLERLSPAERAAFVLHDVFQFSFDAVGEIVGRTPAACRQLASRARRHVADEAEVTRFTVEPEEQRRVAERFIAACAGGDLDALLEVLDPDVAGEADTGGLVWGPQAVVRGRATVAHRALVWLHREGVTLSAVCVNGEAGVVAFDHGHVFAVLALTVESERVTLIHSIVNPHKLAHVAALLDR
jgi:RNA polymerase sigma-70 factor (ECF subfamily)